MAKVKCKDMAYCKQHQQYKGIEEVDDSLIVKNYICRWCGRKWRELYLYQTTEVVEEIIEEDQS